MRAYVCPNAHAAIGGSTGHGARAMGVSGFFHGPTNPFCALFFGGMHLLHVFLGS